VLDLGDGTKKTYLMPTFYSNTSCGMGIFSCNFSAAQKLLPHKDMMALPLVIFSSYEYREVSGMAPYNEIAMVIPVIIKSMWPKFGYYVFSMPVTSKENEIRGRKIWGLPKHTQSIDIGVNKEDYVTTAYDREDKPYFTLYIPTYGKLRHIDSYANIYSIIDDQVKFSRTYFKGQYALNYFVNKPCLKISPTAKILQDLKINPRPLYVRYAESINAAFVLPV
jgi:hypothetical protein